MRGTVRNSRSSTQSCSRLEVVQRVNLTSGLVLGDIQNIAIDLAGGRFGGDGGAHSGRQGLGDCGQAIDHFLPGRLVGVAVLPVHFEVAEAEERLTADGLQAGHAPESHFEGDGDLPFDLLRGSAGELSHDLDDGRCRIGVGLDIDVQEGIKTYSYQSRAAQEDDEGVVERPLNDLTNHINSISKLKRRKNHEKHEKHEKRQKEKEE